MHSLTEDEVRKRLQPAEVIAAIEDAFRDRYHSTFVPVRSQMNLATGVFLVMPCYDSAGQALGMKLAMVQNQPKTPESRVQATYMLLNPLTAQPVLAVPANYLTDLRTAATSAAATKTRVCSECLAPAARHARMFRSCRWSGGSNRCWCAAVITTQAAASHKKCFRKRTCRSNQLMLEPAPPNPM
jgi:Ornithine cyclodeaminase/mu-crystallin family